MVWLVIKGTPDSADTHPRPLLCYHFPKERLKDGGIDGVQITLPPKMVLWNIKYFKLKESKK